MPATRIRSQKFIADDGTPIFYQRRLPLSSPPRAIILLVHGLGEHSNRYTYLFQRLVAEGYAFYAPDHRGFGRSGGPRGHVRRFDRYVRDLKQLKGVIDEDFPATPKVIYGHSMGGLITLSYAMAHPADFATLVAASPGLANPPRAGRLLLAALRVISLIHPTYSLDGRGDHAGLSRDPAEVQRAMDDALCHGRITARWVTEFLKAQRRARRRPERLTTPSVLIIQGTGDTKVIPRVSRDFFKRLEIEDKTYRSYPGFYHELHNDLYREQVLDDIAAWLNHRHPVVG
ncbi:MAG: lysophospholipase [Desulfobacterales bacterium]|nr:lysophospholipase [Desulfobacterales bacterium]